MSSVFLLVDPYNISLLRTIALQSIEAESLQSPALPVLEHIIRFALCSTDMFYAVALTEPDDQQLREFFVNCVLAAVSRPAGVSDARAE